MDKTKKKKDEMQQLSRWQKRLTDAESAAEAERQRMEKRTALYEGTRDIEKTPGAQSKKEPDKATYVRNIVAECIESQVDPSFPMPKVTARRESDIALAQIAEDYLRNETDRLPFERMNDIDERISPIQGGDIFLVEWDSDRHTHETRGELVVTLLHPKQVLFQDGVAEVNDMDYLIIQEAMTKKHVETMYGVSMEGEAERNPDVRGGSRGSLDELVTVNYGYFRNEKGGIGRFVWVNDTVLESMEDYQARKMKKCAKCDAERSDGEEKCPYCGSTKIVESDKETFQLSENVTRSDKTEITQYEEEEILPMEGMPEMMMDEAGNLLQLNVEPQINYKPRELPYYKPDIYPVVVRKNVSSWGKPLGDSDVDKIADQQNAIKKIDTRIMEKLSKGGSVLTKSSKTNMEYNDDQLKVVNFDSPEERASFGVHNLQPNMEYDLAVGRENYEHSRNVLGITNSMQGRPDPTATSGVAKQIAVAQSAGRLESKRIMKNAAYADLYEVMFKFLLAYADEPRPVRHNKMDGSTDFSVFNKYDFLRQDAAGEWYWVDDFLFSVDSASALAGNREAMWQEIRMNLQTGAFGNPQDPDTLILFWSMMAGQHYPLARDVKEQLEAKRDAAMEAQQMPVVPESQISVPDAGVQDGAGSAMNMMGGMPNGM